MLTFRLTLANGAFSRSQAKTNPGTVSAHKKRGTLARGHRCDNVNDLDVWRQVDKKQNKICRERRGLGGSGVVWMFLDKKSGPERWRNKNRTKINKTGNSCKASEASTESDNLLLCSLDSLSEILANAEERFLLKNETLFLFVF